VKISIWQQFSGNHSADFTVVGVFQSPERAIQCANVITDMLKKIRHAQVERESQEQIRSQDMTAVEIELSKQWGVEWNHRTLDWAWQYNTAIRCLDNYVFIENVEGETWSGARPIDQLVVKLGGTPVVEEPEAGMFTMTDVSFSAVDESSALQLEAELNVLFASGEIDEEGIREFDLDIVPPWASFNEDEREPPRGDVDICYGNLSRTGKRIDLTKLGFYDIGYGLPALVAYLKAKGCIEINYTIYGS
jgi:hypothetical protein